jgi:outer membrane biosynthesis protein TonB
MRGFFLTVATAVLAGGSLLAAEVEVKTKPTATPAKAPAAPAASPTVAPAATAAQLPQYRPALLGAGPASVINRMDAAALVRDGQKDGAVSFSCSVRRTGEIANVWTYRGTPDSTLLERELVRCLDSAVFVPAIHNRQTVHALFFGTVTFKVVDGKPRLRIFANQEPEELKKESDFVGPQPFVGPGSKFEGLHYPNDSLTSELSGLVELAVKVDANGNMKELKIISETPPLAGFRRAAAEDFRVASFIPAFRDGKPVECSVTLPVYYEPMPPQPVE